MDINNFLIQNIEVMTINHINAQTITIMTIIKVKLFSSCVNDLGGMKSIPVTISVAESESVEISVDATHV